MTKSFAESPEILLVEDSPQDAELTIRAIRKQHVANEIQVLEDGAAALDYVFGRGQYAGRNLNHMPRVILLDIKLPKLNGLEVLRALKADARTRSIPVVIVTFALRRYLLRGVTFGAIRQ